LAEKVELLHACR